MQFNQSRETDKAKCTDNIEIFKRKKLANFNKLMDVRLQQISKNEKKKMKQNAKKPMKTFDGNLSWDLFLDGQN